MYSEARIIRMFISTRIIDNCDVIILDIKDVDGCWSHWQSGPCTCIDCECKSNAVT